MPSPAMSSVAALGRAVAGRRRRIASPRAAARRRVERGDARERRAETARRMRRRAVRALDAGGRTRAAWTDEDGERENAARGWEDARAGSGGGVDGGTSARASSPMDAMDAYMREDFVDVARGGGGGGGGAQTPDDIITDAGQWPFEDEGDWLEPQYKEVNAAPGTMLEKVQRMHLGEPSDFSFRDGEYFDLMGYVKHKTDNEFCLVLEVAERARERKMERCESAQTNGQRLPPIQQVRRDGLDATRDGRDASSGDDEKRIVEHRVAKHADKTAPSISVATREERIRRSFDARAISTTTLTNFPSRQAIADLALEIELSGGKTSAYLAMREAADRARLRYELQLASWCWDKYSEDSMRSLGVSDKAEAMLHQGERIDEAMDFERELMYEDMSDSETRRY